MRKKNLFIISVLAALAAAGALVAQAVAPPPARAQVAGGFDFTRPSTVASNLAIPWGLAFLPDGSALVGERATARLLQIRPGQAPQVLGTVPGAVSNGEGGLLGIALSPTYAQDQWVYAYYTSSTDNRIVRFRLNALQNQQVILSGLQRASFHDGGRIAFGPDGNLYAGVGDAGNTANAQNTQVLNGKILRMTPTGGVPAGNPFGNLVYSYGHRNVQGLAWDPQGRLFATEFGQDTWDEINLIVPGDNYGWPTVEGVGNRPGFHDPLVTWPTSQASPSGAAIANGTLFAAALAGQRLWTMTLTGNGGVNPPVAELQGQFGRLRTVMLGPDGWLWVMTSNRDGRGTPAATDDRILRFPPVGGAPSSVPPSQGSPSPSPSPSPSRPSPSSPPPAGGCTATYQVVNSWPGGFQAGVTVTAGGSAIGGWTVSWTLPSGQTISQLWNGTLTTSGPTATVRNVSYNGSLPAGGSTSFGFLGGSSISPPASPGALSCTSS